MAWKEYLGISYPFIPSIESFQKALRSLKVNENCFIRKEHKCGKIYGASKSCFIASSDEDELQLILGLISEKLSKVGIEAVIAVKERAYGQDIFCTKICGKIIESKFCIVILDDSKDNGKNIPNPNVYYEYGLMTSLEKHIIPLQKENMKLAFNIQSHDTIKYTSKNIAAELDRAIKDAIKIADLKVDEKSEVDQTSEKTIMRQLEISGFEIKEPNWFLYNTIEDTGFKGLGQYDKGFYVYLGKLDNESEKRTYLEDLNVIIYRTKKAVEKLEQNVVKFEEHKKYLKESIKRTSRGRLTNFGKLQKESEISTIDKDLRDRKSKLKLTEKIYIGFIINPDIDTADFIKSIKTILAEHKRYELTYNKDKIIKFGDIEVNMEISSQ